MELKTISEIKTEDEARSIAIDFQKWASDESLSYSEIIEFNGFF